MDYTLLQFRIRIVLEGLGHNRSEDEIGVICQDCSEDMGEIPYDQTWPYALGIKS